MGTRLDVELDDNLTIDQQSWAIQSIRRTVGVKRAAIMDSLQELRTKDGSSAILAEGSRIVLQKRDGEILATLSPLERVLFETLYQGDVFKGVTSLHEALKKTKRWHGNRSSVRPIYARLKGKLERTKWELVYKRGWYGLAERLDPKKATAKHETTTTVDRARARAKAFRALKQEERSRRLKELGLDPGT